jgi:hypothetical protein
MGRNKAPIAAADIKEVISQLKEIKYPGLTPGSNALPALAQGLIELLPAMAYKESRSSLWAVLLGGTGTGKSAVFNALCGAPISASGVERPKTSGTIGYVHDDEDIIDAFPFPSIEPVSIHLCDLEGPVSGRRGQFQAVRHSAEELKGIVLVDTPDLDSLEPENRITAEKFSFLADVVVFVTSQEKYADETPYLILKRETEAGKTCFLIVNKVSEDITLDEISRTLSLQEVTGESLTLALVPYIPGDPSIALADQKAIRELKRFLLEKIHPDKGPSLLSRTREINRMRAVYDLSGLAELLSLERKATDDWKVRLGELSSKASKDLISLEEKRFASESRQYIKTQIRALFDRYDLLARPRKFVSDLILFPFKMLGVVKNRVTGSREEILERMKRKGPSAPLRETVEKLNRDVLTDLSPLDEHAPLHSALRKQGLKLGEKEIEELISLQNQRLLSWLEDAFARLSKGLTSSKKWGIYTTSMLWGVMILALETVVGGGFTVLDAILGSTLAPLVTKGAVELFATQEIRKITRELASLHRQGLLSVVEEQTRRYADCMERLVPFPETFKAVERLEERLSQKV